MILALLSLVLAQPPRNIVGGAPAAEESWQDAVALYSPTRYACAGTLVTEKWVLTAGHCVGLSHAIVGGTDLSTDGEEREVLDIVYYPETLDTYDLALVQLSSSVDIPPRAILMDCLTDFLIEGAEVTVAGWGRVSADGQQETTILHEVNISVDDASCADPDRGCREQIAPQGEFIAGGHGKDSCTGDSGGPAYLHTPDGIVLAGVVSRAALPSSAICGDGGIYVRPDAVIDWIEQTTGVQLPRPDCEGFNRPPRPTAEPIVVTQGRSVSLQWAANDPDPHDQHTLTVIDGPSRGHFADGVYTAEPFQVGGDQLIFRVEDSGSPPLTAILTVPIQVLPAGILDDPITPQPTCGCSSSGPTYVGLFSLTRRRSLPSCRCPYRLSM